MKKYPSTHHFVKQTDGSKVCTYCGDEKGIDELRICSYSLLVRNGRNELFAGAIDGGVNTEIPSSDVSATDEYTTA
jgi:hypothetical protein